MADSLLDTVGTNAKRIAVRFSIRTIQLFSEGLYSSPHKAIEELVSNSYDAGAHNVHVIMRDLGQSSGSIVVMDDGIGMDAEGLEEHWMIGHSNKRDASYVPPLGRAPIGKFGIGKLATYVLADKFHIVSKRGGKFWIATMDYQKMMSTGPNLGVTKPAGAKPALVLSEEREYRLWIRRMTATEAQRALKSDVSGEGPGYESIKLFGPDAAKTWTVAVLTELRPRMAEPLKLGITRWVLSTALPLRSDFHVYLDGNAIASAKEKIPLVQRWRLGDYVPDVSDVVKYTDPKKPLKDISKVGIAHAALGRVYGSFELYEDVINTGKSERFGRSHGFFVYVRGRLLNEEDAYFGIPENSLRHGTFSRFRMDVHIDALDEELRSSRETYAESAAVEAARDILKACFDAARVRQRIEDEEHDPTVGVVDRLAKSPRSVTTTPIILMARRAMDGDISPRLTSFVGKSAAGAALTFKDLEARARENRLFEAMELVTNLSADGSVCVFDIASATLNVNLMHPFVAHFADEVGSKRAELLLELFATSEVLLEASLYQNIKSESTVRDLIEQRDKLLRSLARSAESRSPNVVAMRLTDQASSWKRFELALVDAFSAMGYYAHHIGLAKNPDGIAEAKLTPRKDGERRAYKVSLEAKKHQANVSKDEAHVGTVTIHRDKNGCDHAIIVARSFTEGEEATLTHEVRRMNESDRLRFDKMTDAEIRKQPEPKTVTLARVDDIAALVRLFSYKRIPLDELRRLYGCETPAQVANFVAAQRESAPNRRYFPEILSAIESIQARRETSLIQYGMIELVLHDEFHLSLEKEEIMDACRAMQFLSDDLLFAQDGYVELNSHPEMIKDAIHVSINDFPESDRRALRAVFEGPAKVVKGNAKRTSKGKPATKKTSKSKKSAPPRKKRGDS